MIGFPDWRGTERKDSTDVERGLIARYLHRVLARKDLSVRVLRAVAVWMIERENALALSLPKPVSELAATFYSGAFDYSSFERVMGANRSAMLTSLDTIAASTPRPEPVATNVELLVAELGLPKAAWKVVGVFACYYRFEAVRSLCDALWSAIPQAPALLSLLTAEPVHVIEQLLEFDGDLAASGLVQVRSDPEAWGMTGNISIPSQINRGLDKSHDTFDALRATLLGPAVTSDNDLSDYEHVAADRDLVVGVLRGGGATGASGINVLLHGPPGSGKTEMAKVTAAAAGLTLYSVGEHSNRGGEADRAERLAALLFALRLLKDSRAVAILFDEMEDIAWQFMPRGGSKAFLNRLLEGNSVPILWTSNNIGELDPALLRRMLLAVELKLPPPVQRARILRRIAARAGVPLTDDEVDRLARRIDATPAVMDNALRAARLAGGGADEVERAALGIRRAAFGTATRRTPPAAVFVPELTCADRDLVTLADHIINGGRLKFSFCLSGPPGTGKSAFARYLARRLGLEVLQKRASDLLGMFVGESEKRIAAAFEEAREGHAFLIFDEADSLLFDRRDASRSWEISQVNEMLTQMEDHGLPVCFTTNLMDRIDAASLRRFTFHIRFSYLDREGLRRAWATFFGVEHPPADAYALANLTPGDFTQAREQAEVLGQLGNARHLLGLLYDISRTKPGAAGTMGFMQ